MAVQRPATGRRRMSSATSQRAAEEIDAVERRRFLADVLEGLSRPPKSLPAKYFYDERGLSLFKSISETPEYYLTRSEMSIMQGSAAEIAATIGPGCLLIEYGSGAPDKAALLLASLERPAGYISIDISKEHLDDAVASLEKAHPELEIVGLRADFTSAFQLPQLHTAAQRRVIYFAGSTIGNFEPSAASALLRGMQRHLRSGDGLLIGIDLKKEIDRLERAYNDTQGLTEAFNRNILVRINRELGADFDPGSFEHRAFYSHQHDRIEMHLVSRRQQTVHVGGSKIHFLRGESIHTESCYKYDLAEFAAWAAKLGFALEKVWTDSAKNFGVLFLTLDSGALTGDLDASPRDETE